MRAWENNATRGEADLSSHASIFPSLLILPYTTSYAPVPDRKVPQIRATRASVPHDVPIYLRNETWGLPPLSLARMVLKSNVSLPDGGTILT